MGSLSLVKRIAAAATAFRKFEGYDEKKWNEWQRGPMTAAGTRVNEVSSLSISAVFAAINFLAGTFAMLPKVILKRLPGGGTARAYEHPLYDRFHNKPNDSEMTAWQWIYTSIFHKYLWGNWYTWIDRQSYARQELIPLLPDRTWLDPENDQRYITHIKNGQKIPQRIFIPRSQVLHIPHISLDGDQGRGVIYYARESLGLVKAQDEFAATFFGSGIHPGGFVEVDKPMDEEVRQGLQKDFNEKYGGLGRLWKAIFMSGGAKFEEAEIDATKAQALESRQFSVVEVSRWMNLPPHVLRELSRSTFSNIEHQGIELVTYSILPATTQIEQAMNIMYFDDEERQTYFVKFELKKLLQGDMKARTEFYKTMLDRAVFNADMVLDLEDMNPQPDGLGKIFVMPLNMVNKEMLVSPQPLTIENKSSSLVERATVQIVKKRSAALRRRLTIAYKPKFEQFAQQLVKKETDAVRAAVKEMLSQHGIAEFNAWLAGFYRDFGKEIDVLVAPLIISYATAVLPVAQEEINSDSNIDSQYLNFQREYREVFAQRHVISSREQLEAIIRDTQKEDMSELEALEQRLTEWEEKRPGKIVMRETVRAENAFTRSVFALCGIAKIRSIAYGDNCPYCQDLDGKVIGIEEYFLPKGDFQPDGAERPLTVTSNHSHPPYHDGCLPGHSRVLAECVSSASKRWYDGDLIIVKTARGHELQVTSNHPILTPQGWIAAGALDKGSDVISRLVGNWIEFGDSNDQNRPSRIEDIAETLLDNPGMVAVPVPTTAENFHGDGIGSKVAIVGADRKLWDRVYAPLVKQGSKIAFVGRNPDSAPLPGLRSQALFSDRLPSPLSRTVSRGRLGFSLRGRHSSGSYYSGITMGAERDVALPEMASDYAPIDSERQRKAIDRLSGQIAPDKIVSIKRDSFHGFVFNLQTGSGFYLAEGIIAHNCDCGIEAGT